MRALIFLVLILALFITPGAADNVTIELFQNSQDIFFVQYNDELFECTDDDECTFEVANFTDNCTYDNGTRYDLSSKDKKDIAQYTVKYLVLENGAQAFTGGVVNDSALTASLGNTREDITDNIRSYMDTTLIPEIARFDELEQKLTLAENEVATLKVKGDAYDKQLLEDNEVIEVYKSKADDANFISTLCLIGIVFIAITCTPAGRGFIESLVEKISRK